MSVTRSLGGGERGSPLVPLLLAAIRKELPHCLAVTRQYVPVKRYPCIYVVSPTGRLVLNGTVVPEWVRAFTIRDDVFVLAHPNRWNTDTLVEVLCHELFHAGVYAYCGRAVPMPRWLNEAIARSIVQRERNTAGPLADRSVPTDPRGNDVCRIIDADESLAEIVDRVSVQLLLHPPATIRRTLELAKKRGEWESAIRTLIARQTEQPRRWREAGAARCT